MRIGLDVRMIQSSGIGTTIRGLLENLTSEQRQKLLLFGHERKPAFPECSFQSIPYKIYGFRQHWSYGRMLNNQALSLFHMPHFDVPLAYKGPLVVTIHDLIHYLFPEYSTKPFTRAYSWFMLRHAALRASRILVDSKNTKSDFLNLFPKASSKVDVVYPAVDPLFKPVAPEVLNNVMRLYSLTPGYLLYVGNLRESKNSRGLVRAYLKARKDKTDLPPLLLVGKNSLKNFDCDKLTPHVRHLSEVPTAYLPALYGGASMFVFPSFYEGFGLPPLEAMACGTPVIASRAGSLLEVCGEAAEYVDPHSIDSMAQTMVQLHHSKEWRNKLREKGFDHVKRYSWSSFAKKTWNIYEDVLREQGQ